MKLCTLLKSTEMEISRRDHLEPDIDGCEQGCCIYVRCLLLQHQDPICSIFIAISYNGADCFNEFFCLASI